MLSTAIALQPWSNTCITNQYKYNKQADMVSPIIDTRTTVSDETVHNASISTQCRASRQVAGAIPGHGDAALCQIGFHCTGHKMLLQPFLPL